jgi:hypothetical protein
MFPKISFVVGNGKVKKVFASMSPDTNMMNSMVVDVAQSLLEQLESMERACP